MFILIQVQGITKILSSDIPSYYGLRHCVRKVYRTEGFRAFYKGGVPSLVKVCTCRSSAWGRGQHLMGEVGQRLMTIV